MLRARLDLIVQEAQQTLNYKNEYIGHIDSQKEEDARVTYRSLNFIYPVKSMQGKKRLPVGVDRYVKSRIQKEQLFRLFLLCHPVFIKSENFL